jgi:hypothetical protein
MGHSDTIMSREQNRRQPSYSVRGDRSVNESCCALKSSRTFWVSITLAECCAFSAADTEEPSGVAFCDADETE